MGTKNKIVNNASNAFLLVASLICLFFISETLYRVYHKIVYNIPLTKSIGEFYDPLLGWRGKKVFGDTSTEKYKIFFIGDSFTDGCGVGEKKMYYTVIKENLGAEIFVYGGFGYGTLQEYMVLDKYYDEIKPDLIILQVSGNDFINNLWELESASFINNNPLIRPYWINGKIEYRCSGSLGKQRVFLSTHSRILYSLFNRMDRLCSILARKGLLHSVEKDISQKGIAFGNFKKAKIVTKTLIQKMKNRVGRTPIIAFPVSDKPIYLEQFRDIFKENNIEFIEDVPVVIKERETEGVNLRLKDKGHWNEVGQQICGEVLVKEMRQRGYVK
jgi:lysophospholipase L1-like esterase